VLLLVRCDWLGVITFIDFRFSTVTETPKKDSLNTTSTFMGNSVSPTLTELTTLHPAMNNTHLKSIVGEAKEVRSRQ